MSEDIRFRSRDCIEGLANRLMDKYNEDGKAHTESRKVRVYEPSKVMIRKIGELPVPVKHKTWDVEASVTEDGVFNVVIKEVV